MFDESEVLSIVTTAFSPGLFAAGALLRLASSSSSSPSNTTTSLPEGACPGPGPLGGGGGGAMVTCVIGEEAGSFKGPSARRIPRISSSQASLRKRWSARCLVSPGLREPSAGLGAVDPTGLFGPDERRPLCDDWVGLLGKDGVLLLLLLLLLLFLLLCDDDDDGGGRLGRDDEAPPCEEVGLFDKDEEEELPRDEGLSLGRPRPQDPPLFRPLELLPVMISFSFPFECRRYDLKTLENLGQRTY